MLTTNIARVLDDLTERSDALLDELNLSDPILHELRESDADLFVGEIDKDCDGACLDCGTPDGVEHDDDCSLAACEEDPLRLVKRGQGGAS